MVCVCVCFTGLRNWVIMDMRCGALESSGTRIIMVDLFSAHYVTREMENGDIDP